LSGKVRVVQLLSTTPNDGVQQPNGSLLQFRSVLAPPPAWFGMNSTFRAKALYASS
jgi:hypothetical protein